MSSNVVAHMYMSVQVKVRVKARIVCVLCTMPSPQSVTWHEAENGVDGRLVTTDLELPSRIPLSAI